MKSVFLCSFFILLNSAIAAPEGWHPIAETSQCGEKVQILGKDGEKYVLAVHNSSETKLFSQDASVFNKNSMKNTVFLSKDYKFIHPSYVEGNPPKIIFNQNGMKQNCRMVLKPL